MKPEQRMWFALAMVVVLASIPACTVDKDDAPEAPDTGGTEDTAPACVFTPGTYSGTITGSEGSVHVTLYEDRRVNVQLTYATGIAIGDATLDDACEFETTGVFGSGHCTRGEAGGRWNGTSGNGLYTVDCTRTSGDGCYDYTPAHGSWSVP